MSLRIDYSEMFKLFEKGIFNVRVNFNRMFRPSSEFGWDFFIWYILSQIWIYLSNRFIKNINLFYFPFWFFLLRLNFFFSKRYFSRCNRLDIWRWVFLVLLSCLYYVLFLHVGQLLLSKIMLSRRPSFIIYFFLETIVKVIVFLFV